MDFLDVILISLIVILLLLLVVIFPYIDPSPGSLMAANHEKFDTYFNHDFAASEIYEDPNVERAALYAKYAWSERDRAGFNVYDRAYDRLQGALAGRDYEYPYRDIGAAGEENVYDSRFQLLDGRNRFANFTAADMVDCYPATARVTTEGVDAPSRNTVEIIRMSQKNY
jgi:hypothetical protein